MIAVRLNAGDDLKQSICKMVTDNGLTGAAIVSAVGSLDVVVLRMAGATPEKQDVRTYTDTYEIVSLIGTIDVSGKAHLHMSVSNREGVVIGGHLKDGCIVHTTAEIVLTEDKSLLLERKIDDATGFDELFIERVKT